MAIQKSRTRNIVDGVYDIPELTIATVNRIVIRLHPDAVAETKEGE